MVVSTSKEVFQAQLQLLQMDFKNSLKKGAAALAADRLWNVMSSEQLEVEALIDAAKAVSFDELLHFVPQLLAELSCELFIHGQVELHDAIDTWNLTKAALWPQTTSTIQPEPLHRVYYYHPEVRALPTSTPGAGPFVLPVSGSTRNNAAVLVVDGGVLNCQDHLALELIYPVISSAFFSDLRTKQQLGYLVSTTITTMLGRTMALFVVESSFAPPANIIVRMDAFIKKTLSMLADGTLLKEKDLQQAIATREAECKVPVQDIAAMSSLLRTVLLDLDGDFDVLSKRCSMLPKLTRAKAVKVVQKLLSEENLRRLAVVYSASVSPSQQREVGQLSKTLPGYSVMKPEVTLASGRKYLDSYGHFVPRPKYVCKALVDVEN